MARGVFVDHPGWPARHEVKAMTVDWLVVLSGLALAAVIAVLAWLGLRGGALRHEQACRFVCPVFGAGVDCRIVQDVRTGQWKQVEACSAFRDLSQVLCDQDCAKAMNLGFRLSTTPGA
jgi:hypothetical protein